MMHEHYIIFLPPQKAIDYCFLGVVIQWNYGKKLHNITLHGCHAYHELVV